MKILIASSCQLRSKERDRPVFNIIDRMITHVPLNLVQIAAITPEEHEVEIIYETSFSQVDFSKEYDVVGLSCITRYAPRAYEIADAFRKRGIPVILGGYHPSAMSEDAKQHADAVVIGEAELTWPQVLKDVENGNLKPFYKQEKLVDPEDIPQPNRELIKGYRSIGVQATRGCPYRCDYCAIQNVEGHRFRKRPIEDVISEIKTLRRKYFSFYDASLTIDAEYTKDLFRAMIGLKKRFDCNANIHTLINDEKLLKLAKRAGCELLHLGLDSISQKSLDDVRRVNKVEMYAKAIQKIRRQGLSVKGLFMFGFDNDTTDIFSRTLKAAIQYKIDVGQFTVLTPFPGTVVYKKLEKEGRILSRDWAKYTLGNVVFQPKHMTAQELYENTKKVSNEFHSFRNISKRILDNGNIGFQAYQNKLYISVTDHFYFQRDQGF